MSRATNLFDKISQNLQKHFFIFFAILLCFGILVIKASTDIIFENHNSSQVLAEMDFIASEEVTMINRAMDRNFIPLAFIADYLSSHGGFKKNLNSDFLKAMIDSNQWTALRYAANDNSNH